MSEHRIKQPAWLQEMIEYEREALLKLKQTEDFFTALATEGEDYELQWLEMVAQNKQDIARLSIAERNGKHLDINELARIYCRSARALEWGWLHDRSPERRKWCGDRLRDVKKEQDELARRFGWRLMVLEEGW